MKLLRRNTTEFEYYPYIGMIETLTEDEDGTGEYHPSYDQPVKMRGNISAPSGMVNQTFYGEDIRYTHVLVMDDPKADIKESGMIRWNGKTFDIRAVRPSMNVLSIALREQTMDHAEGED